MCGICGYIDFEQEESQHNLRIIEKMNQRLLHRGPDSQSTVLFGNLFLGFSRLSIIGLENGMQPITNEDGSIILICNGEIFNYVELITPLRAKGHKFKTDSDVEVILHLYEEYGYNFLNMLNGQFAFALYDQKQRRLFCARDQMGIAPFYYTMAQGTFIFASEIKAIIEHPAVERKVDLVALDQIITFAGLISPRTMFEGISSLENGHYLIISENGKLEKKEYWDLIYPKIDEVTEAQSEEFYKNKLDELFTDSVRLRLRADVRTGFYLSGGLDSSLIAMKVNQINPTAKNEAFSIDFVDSSLSESFYQNIIARESNSRLNQQIFFYDDISKRLKQAIYHCECPIKETYNTASLSLSEAVRRKGIKVILSGEGADELLAGYVGYRFDRLRATHLLKNSVNPAEQVLRKKIWGNDFFYERDYLAFNLVKNKIFSNDLKEKFETFNCLNHPIINKDRIANRDIIHKRAYVDFKLRLVDHLVSDHGDRMALANGVEVRYPFLDKNLVEFTTQIPPDLKLNGLTEKYILKRMAKGIVSDNVIEREKFGFVAPGSPYLIQRNIEYINDLLSYENIKSQNIFNPVEVERLKRVYGQPGFSINAPFEDDLLSIVITFGIFWDHFFKS